MLAVNHSILATACVLAASVFLNLPFFLPLLILVVFASIAPDVDHPNSELGRKFVFLSRVLPHRGITHSFVGVGIFAALMYFGFGVNDIFTYFLIGCAIIGAQFLEKIIIRHAKNFSNLSKKVVSSQEIEWIIHATAMVINVFLFLLVFLVWNQRLRVEIVVLLTAGYILHVIGDFITKEGVPLTWPLKKKYGLRLFKTGGVIESLFGFFLAAANVYLILVFVQQYGVLEAAYWTEYIQIN